jgi:copper homeostasis protein
MSKDGQPGRQVLLEIAVDSAADAELAVDLGADRLELCASLDRHGLTPDPGLVREVTRRTRVPVMAMLRPRSGSFVLASAELERLCDQAAALLAAGASGLVFGALREDGTVDARACERILESAGGSDLTFHRALDLTPDPRAAGEQLARLGFRRILTAGMSRAETAAALGLQPVARAAGSAPLADRLDRLRGLVVALGGRIDVLAGGGVRADNALQFLSTGCRELHSSCRPPGGRTLDAPALTDLRRRLAEHVPGES